MPQGTIKEFDAQTGSGSLLLDSQEELAFDATTFAASHLWDLRLGQRVRVSVEGEGEQRRVTALQLVSL
ncbi:MAG: cold-shock protein [Actinomycetota bacterium]